MKRIIALVLVFLACFSFTVFAESEDQAEGSLGNVRVSLLTGVEEDRMLRFYLDKHPKADVWSIIDVEVDFDLFSGVMISTYTNDTYAPFTMYTCDLIYRDATGELNIVPIRENMIATDGTVAFMITDELEQLLSGIYSFNIVVYVNS